ncbi:hypothetical protein EXIGLDRAFT_357741 [Exidia glandulosa HHB12029]|uniref:F-box domain-containing protein n=1 Tax=Exidia glandulosa HHB12029 TaxID=1314781 RepID=A0A165LAR9_EXIGL|nr:hypothetical protein EXIGLDRAFT_357741 [Exidia glandulosa HHB12029]
MLRCARLGASTRFEACAAIASAVHDALSAVKTEHNDDIEINKLPPEVLGSIFFHLTITNNRPLRVLTRTFVVCRH